MLLTARQCTLALTIQYMLVATVPVYRFTTILLPDKPNVHVSVLKAASRSVNIIDGLVAIDAVPAGLVKRCMSLINP